MSDTQDMRSYTSSKPHVLHTTNMLPSLATWLMILKYPTVHHLPTQHQQYENNHYIIIFVFIYFECRNAEKSQMWFFRDFSCLAIGHPRYSNKVPGNMPVPIMTLLWRVWYIFIIILLLMLQAFNINNNNARSIMSVWWSTITLPKRDSLSWSSLLWLRDLLDWSWETKPFSPPSSKSPFTTNCKSSFRFSSGMRL